MLAEELRGHCGRIRWKRFYDDAASSEETERDLAFSSPVWCM